MGNNSPGTILNETVSNCQSPRGHPPWWGTECRGSQEVRKLGRLEKESMIRNRALQALKTKKGTKCPPILLNFLTSAPGDWRRRRQEEKKIKNLLNIRAF
jgi:hypothetical protein